jgi:hypothetical protein
MLYISDNTHVLLIPPMNITHTTLKNRWYIINLNRQILTLGPFILHTSHFQPVVHGDIVYRKNIYCSEHVFWCIYVMCC